MSPAELLSVDLWLITKNRLLSSSDSWALSERKFFWFSFLILKSKVSSNIENTLCWDSKGCNWLHCKRHHLKYLFNHWTHFVRDENWKCTCNLVSTGKKLQTSDSHFLPSKTIAMTPLADSQSLLSFAGSQYCHCKFFFLWDPSVFGSCS